MANNYFIIGNVIIYLEFSIFLVEISALKVLGLVKNLD